MVSCSSKLKVGQLVWYRAETPLGKWNTISLGNTEYKYCGISRHGYLVICEHCAVRNGLKW